MTLSKTKKSKSISLTVSITGGSNSGKTQLIQRLIPELKRRGHSVAVIKHCSKGFTLDLKGKDSWKLMQAGSERVAMISKDQVAVLQKIVDKLDIRIFREKYFHDVDIVLVEGGRNDPDLKKIEVLRRGVSEKIECSPKELMFVVADWDVDVDKPVYHPDNIVDIANVLIHSAEHRGTRVRLTLEGTPVPLNSFVQKIFENIILGTVSSLKAVKKNPKRITLTIERNVDENTKQ